MSEPGTTNTQAPDGLVGLATGLGALRSDLNHHIDDQNRAFNELRTEQAERVDALETTVSELETRFATLVGTVDDAVTAIQDYLSRYGAKPPKAATGAESETSPERKSGETNSAFYKRLVRWAEEQEVDAPPKPKSGPMGQSIAAYDRAIAEWNSALES